MSEKSYVVPLGMLKAGVQATWDVPFNRRVHDNMTRRILEAALKWQAENPVVPTSADIDAMVAEWQDPTFKSSQRAGIDIAVQWQRRMYLAPPEPDDFERECRGLLDLSEAPKDWVVHLREAYERGRKAR